ncbi:phospho-sugar mutase [Ferrimonas sp. SCSIO 43195]|uniref:phospho-sugar mutase n=1 Tax=Ferrimonas sp. SCSIO 43195 TaxID=2822844 RepID=UPI002076477C|nr:phospho-sugar mutase [Ferrimonas sp. SCSIO 43195]USD39460.1 phospho-sugar mutase [Ferrimonas sp. SCSIO 43195]
MNAEISRWIVRDPDANTRQELQALVKAQDTAALESRFKARLAFGTAGLRGVVGAGPNRMNRLVIQETATGLGHYLKSQNAQAAEQGVVIGYDGRPDSRQFAMDSAAVLTAQGIKVYLTVRVAATPLVAYGVNHLGTAAAIVVTASHNPPQYNGFKVYWGNGAQIISPHDSGIAAEIERAAQSELQLMDLDDAQQQGLLVWLDDGFYQSYRDTMKANPLLGNHTQPESISLAYTAMHGVGAEMAEALLADAGFSYVYSVAAQREPDGRFPTVNFPNPEEAGAMDRVIEEARAHGATLACANDPDADRFAVAVRRPDGEYQMLTGDQVGVLFGHYLLSRARPQQDLVGTTIVSSSLLQRIAKAAGARYYQTLTGFKWLTNIAMEQQSDDHQFLFAYEEALGYTVGSEVWDKDGLSALVAFAQMTAELATKGKTIWDQLEAIYRQHGLYLNAQRSIALDPAAPPVGDKLRSAPPTEIAGLSIASVDDLKHSRTTYADGRTETIDLPTSDVLIYHLDGGNRVVVRPSGTEPKLKCYYEVVEPFASNESLASVQQRAEAAMALLIEQHQAQLAR